MITLGVAAIIATFAMPVYREQVARGHRLDAVTALYRAAQSGGVLEWKMSRLKKRNKREELSAQASGSTATLGDNGSSGLDFICCHTR